MLQVNYIEVFCVLYCLRLIKEIIEISEVLRRCRTCKFLLEPILINFVLHVSVTTCRLGIGKQHQGVR